MKYRDKCYKVGHCGYDPTENNRTCISLSSILSELNTREHIPNKKEAKLLRQERAKR